MVTTGRKEGSSAVSAVEAVIGRIKTRLRSGAYTPGQRLVAHELTAEFACSAGVVRESLRQLAGEGLIELHDNRGAQVRSLNRQDVAEIYQLREAVEGLAAQLAAQRIASDGRRQVLKEAMARATKAAQARNAAQYAADNVDFHGLIIELSGNRRIDLIAGQLALPVHRLQLHRFLDRDAIRSSLADHQRIAQAILAGDADAAGEAMREHIRSSGQAVLDLFERDPGDHTLPFSR